MTDSIERAPLVVDPEGRVEEEEDDEDDLGLTGCAGSCFCHPRALCHRLIALSLMCLFGFGSYFCFDNPGALQVIILY